MKKFNYGKQFLDLSDIWQVIKTLRCDFLTQGPKVAEFENAICKYTGAKYAVAVSNATAGLHIAMMALDVGSNDEVITSPITFLASANCALYVGASPKFVDIDSSTACLDVKKLEQAITQKTKIIIPVHFAGQSCNMKVIKEIADKHNLFVVEDSAHAIGSDYLAKKVGCCEFSDMSIFSFHPVKNMTTGEGGVITTNNEKFYKKLLLLRSHGMTKDQQILTKNDGPWYYEMHEFGFNYRLTDIQASLGISQLKKIEKFKKRRREIVEFYKKSFEKDERFSFLEEKDYANSCFHLFPLLINFDKIKISKKDLFLKLQENGLHLQVHYIPIHLQPFYQSKFSFKEGDFPNAEEYYKKTISLPVYYGLNDYDLRIVVKIIKQLTK